MKKKFLIFVAVFAMSIGSGSFFIGTVSADAGGCHNAAASDPGQGADHAADQSAFFTKCEL